MDFGFVAMQMLVVSLPIVLGWAINKLGFLNPELDSGLSQLVMNIALPCTILASLHDAEALPSVETMLLIVAATFLAQFVPEDTSWAHLDIAATAYVGGKLPHSTGRPVGLLLTWLHQMAHARA